MVVIGSGVGNDGEPDRKVVVVYDDDNSGGVDGGDRRW